MESTTKVFLPSKGKFNPLHAEPIILDMMGFEEEKIAFSSATEEALDEVLRRCIKSPENFDVESLTTQDRYFLLMKLRIHTYGDEYHVSYREGDEILEAKISLDDLEVIELPDDFTVPEGVLPVSKNKVELKVLTVGEQRKIADYCREKAEKLGASFSELRYEALQAKRIASVDGEVMDTNKAVAFLKSLKGRDLAYIDHLSSKIDFGYTKEAKITTRKGKELVVPLVMTGEFFRPRFDD